jgi:spore germination cell wall hydrolase CwlJ-like protein
MAVSRKQFHPSRGLGALGWALCSDSLVGAIVLRAPEDTQLGLRAWEQQRRNRRRSVFVRAIFGFTLIGAAVWNLPDAFNPLVIAGLVDAQNQIHLKKAEAVAAAVKTQDAARLARSRPAPAILQTAVEPLPPGPFPASDVKCLADAVYGDARGEHIGGQIGVAQVMLNRQRAAPESTLCQIVGAAQAKGELCRSAMGCPKTTPKATNRYWMQALWIAEEVAAGRAYLRELEHVQRYHFYLAQPVWRLTHRPVRRLGQNVFYINAAIAPDMAYASSRRPWDEPAQFDMIGEDQAPSAGQLVTSSAPAPGVRKPQPVALPTAKSTPAFNPFGNASDMR